MYTHLHVHSEYSLLDGSAKIKDLVSAAKAMGMDSLAITDHGVMYGVIDFYKEAVANGIKPILGCEIYVASGSRFNKNNDKDNFYYHLVLLAENMEGYHNLIKLVSAGFTEGFYYKPRVDTELLRKYSKGLIALSACMSGPVAKTLLRHSYDMALEQALLYDGIFGRGNFYLELQDHGLEDQKTVNPLLLRMSRETGIPLVCTNDCHYIGRDDARAHEILLCIQTGKTINDPDRMVYEGDQFYLKSAGEMKELFSYVPQALENTGKIAERCKVEIKFNEYKLPVFALPEGYEDSSVYLRELCYEGLQKRYGNLNHSQRLDYELSVIKSMGFSDYFLITWDFIKYARNAGISVGPGRGSAAGSIVTYCLRITDVDPMKYDLIFERFLNPERVSMPDIDTDFCYERRQEVIDYVIAKYGADHVAQIITFGTMAARASIRDVGRALAMPYASADRIAKMIPYELNITIDRALEVNPELKKAYEEEEDTKILIDMALKLEGLPRHASTHAAGVVICDKPVSEYVPLNLNDDVVTTQFPMKTVEQLGLLKMDFLGLRTLTVIQSAVTEIRRTKKPDLDMDKIPYDDPKVFELISQAKTEGVFQLESSGMKSFMRELQPSRLEDIINGIALYRPGPMESIPKYIRGKNNPDSVQYTHPSLKPILESTYGCMVFQEHVQKVVRQLAGYSMARSDLVRRAMSKKQRDVMAREREYFIYGLGDDVPGCVKNGISADTAAKIFNEMETFAAYGFPQAHAAAYAIVGYQTAWLKCRYPVEFMAALMTSVTDSTSKIVEYIDECKRMNVELLPPDVNEGYAHFSVSGNKIRFGLLAIKNVGRATIDAMVQERERNGKFKSMTDFISRLEGHDVNKSCLESLIKAGAFDSLGGSRRQYIVAYKDIISNTAGSRKRIAEGQMSLFMLGGEDQSWGDKLPDIEDYPIKEKLANEKEAMGIYVSGHPMMEFWDTVKPYVNSVSTEFLSARDESALTPEPDSDDKASQMYDGKSVSYGGIIISRSIKYTKASGRAMAFLTVEDMYGTVEVIVFSALYERYQSRLAEDRVIVVQGKASVREDENAKIVANNILFYEDLSSKKKTSTLWLKIPAQRPVDISSLTDILAHFPGDTPVIIYDEAQNKKLKVAEKFWVRLNDELFRKLEDMLGSGMLKLV